MSRRRPLGTKTRFRVLHRDNFKCQYCGIGVTAATMHVDHVVSVAHGGSNELSNLKTACRSCNLGKGKTSEVGPLDSFFRLSLDADHENSRVALANLAKERWPDADRDWLLSLIQRLNAGVAWCVISECSSWQEAVERLVVEQICCAIDPERARRILGNLHEQTIAYLGEVSQ